MFENNDKPNKKYLTKLKLVNENRMYGMDVIYTKSLFFLISLYKSYKLICPCLSEYKMEKSIVIGIK